MSDDNLWSYGSGLIRPVSTKEYSKGSINGVPMWIRSTPKDNQVYLYTHSGSTYSISPSTFAVTGLSNLRDEDGFSFGDGMAYYDNYMYFARNTNIARYGPLDGTPSMNKSYWVTTLGKAPLEYTQFPNDASLGFLYPCHVMHRHSDGKLYIADSIGGAGSLHFIKTRKTAVEGDTDDGSSYDVLDFGQGLFVTALATYGQSLVIALMERRSGNYNNGDGFTGAKIAFWDTTSNNINAIQWNTFPDGYVSALKNINGVLYATSGTFNSRGFRVSRYVGGDSWEEVFYFEDGQVPTPGAVDGDANRLLFGSRTSAPQGSGCVWSLNLQKGGFSGIYNIIKSPASTSSSAQSVGVTTAFWLDNNNDFGFNVPQIIGWSIAEDETEGNNGIDVISSSSTSTFDTAPAVWWSQLYKIGQPFKITKIRIPIVPFVFSGTSITPAIYTDSGEGNFASPTYTLDTIDGTSYPSSQYHKSVVIRPKNAVGKNDFWLELKFESTTLTAVGLPITIEYELIDD